MTKLRHLALLAGLALTALPALADEVNVYTTRQPELVTPVLEAFTAETGIEVNVAYIDKGLVERLKAEGRRSPADLVLTVDIANLKRIVDAGVISPIVTPTLESAVPAHLRAADGAWYALTQRARVVYASKARVADGEVTTYEDLASEKWRGRICTRSGVHNYNLALVSAMIVHHGEDFTREWAKGVKANLARKPQGNDRAQVKAIWAGECDISLGNTYYMGKMLENPDQREWAESVRIVFPVFEGGGTHMNVSGMALTRAAPNREAAIRLMEFLVSEKAQQIYAEITYEYPVRPGIRPSALVASWGEFTPD
ncbi:MAG: extracellular solute-binding protein, partial [Alphaproteobacteria bacterium]